MWDFVPVLWISFYLNTGGWFPWFAISGKSHISTERFKKKKRKLKRESVWRNHIWLAPWGLTCREHRTDRYAWAPGSWACASPGGSRKVRWCGADARRTPDPGRSRKAEGSSIPMRPSQRTDARPETHVGYSYSLPVGRIQRLGAIK